MKKLSILAIALILCAFLVLPVNAITVDHNVQSNDIFDLGTITNTTINLGYVNTGSMSQGGFIMFKLPDDSSYTSFPVGPYQTLPIELPSYLNQVTISFRYRPNFNAPTIDTTCTINYVYSSSLPDNDYDIDIDLQEQTIELGNITDLDKSFDIGSSSDRVVKTYTYQSSQNCYIFDLQRNYVNIALNKNNNQAMIYLVGTAQKGTEITDFITTVYFNYTYEEKEKINFEIESIDYDKGLQLIGANITVYYYHELDDLLERVYYNDYSDGLTRIELLNNTDIFIEFELSGYNAVNGQNYDYLQNKYGILTNTKFKSQRLYFSKIDPSVLLYQGFIIKDNNNNALSGVSVTMDNNITLISNQYGGVQFDNINQGSHTFVFTKSGYFTQSLTKSVSVSNTQNVLLQLSAPTTAPTIAPTIAPTPIQTDSSGNIIIGQPSNIADSVKYGLAKIFGVTSLDTINLVFALIIILFPAVVGGVITNQSLAFVAGGMIGFVIALGLGLIPIWVFFAMVMFTVIYLILTTGNNF